MDLYLVRHAAAHDRDPDLWPDDSLRPLTPEGEEAFRRSTGGLAVLAPRVDALLSSPFERAWRTAELLAGLEGWPDPKSWTPLEPTLPPEKACYALEAYGKAEYVAVVGHRPGLHELASYLLSGDAGGAEINIKKGGVVCLRFEGPPAPGAGQLRWLATPKILRAIAGA
ncbi:MAG: histidine phosphatase family protein [Actinomycetota bacterium]|nr:histidine phosphatase family protein [Actinomycetota bacterium]